MAVALPQEILRPLNTHFRIDLGQAPVLVIMMFGKWQSFRTPYTFYATESHKS